MLEHGNEAILCNQIKNSWKLQIFHFKSIQSAQVREAFDSDILIVEKIVTSAFLKPLIRLNFEQ